MMHCPYCHQPLTDDHHEMQPTGFFGLLVVVCPTLPPGAWQLVPPPTP